MIRKVCFNLPRVCLWWVEAQLEDSPLLHVLHGCFFWDVERPPGCFEAETMKLIRRSTKAPADCTGLQPQQRIFPSPLHPALFLYPSLFFHMMLSHNAVKRSIWYWCLPTDVLLAFAVEILWRGKKRLNIITSLLLPLGLVYVFVVCLCMGYSVHMAVNWILDMSKISQNNIKFYRTSSKISDVNAPVKSGPFCYSAFARYQ